MQGNRLTVGLIAFCALGMLAGMIFTTVIGAFLWVASRDPTQEGSEVVMRPGNGIIQPGPGPSTLPSVTTPLANVSNLQVTFARPEAMHVSWGSHGIEPSSLTAPGRANFDAGNSYRLRFSDIPGRPRLVVNATLELPQLAQRSQSYVAHNAVPIQLTRNDLDNVQANQSLVKVIYIPDPELQELAIAGVETLVSVRLTPGIDVVAEADRRGTVLAVLRLDGTSTLANGER